MMPAARNELTTLFLIAGVAILVGIVYADSFVSMAAFWDYSEYSHGGVVFPISTYLLWRLRASLAAADLRPWAWGLVPLAALVLAWFVARIVGVQTVEHLAIVLMIPAGVATCLGLDLVRRALFPLLFMVAAVPFGESVVPYLMRITADVSSVLLRLVGVPVFRDGQFLTLPGGEFEVADVCSGLRYLVAGTVIASLFAYVTYRNNRKRCVFVVATALSLIVANGLRAFIVMYVASATDMRVFAGRDHIYFGWVLFGGVIGALFWLGMRYSDKVEAPVVNTDARVERGTQVWPMVFVCGLLMLAVTAKPFQGHLDSVWLLVPVGVLLVWAVSRALVRFTRVAQGVQLVAQPYWRAETAIVVCIAAAVLVAGPMSLGRAEPARNTATRMVELPTTLTCAAPQPWASRWRPSWPSPDFSAAASYSCDGHPVNVVVVGYLGNTQGRELVGEESRPVPLEWRRFVAHGNHTFMADDGRITKVNEVRVEGDGVRSLIWYWYLVGDRTTTSPSGVKFFQALQTLSGGRSAGAVYWFETPLDSSLETSRVRLAAAAREIEEVPLFADAAEHRHE